MYILDIETVPQEDLIKLFCSRIKAPKNIKDEEKIKAAIAKKIGEAQKGMSVDTDYADILCIGLKEWGFGEPKLYYDIEEVYNIIKDEVVITFNGKKFDFPILVKQSIKKGLNIDVKNLNNRTKRYKAGLHIDLMEELGEYGNYRSLDEYLQIYLGISKKPIDFSTASVKEIEEHCLEDLINTEKLFNLFKKML